MEGHRPASDVGSNASEAARRKTWEPPRIVQHDLLETVAALCQSSPGLVAKATPATCDITQT